jgi:Protein N-terminal asparagine amidohydrolase
MVIPTSDSNSTLVSLGNNNSKERLSSRETVLRSSSPTTTQSDYYDFVASALLAPLDTDGIDIDDECFSSSSSSFEEMDSDRSSDYSCGGGLLGSSDSEEDDGSFFYNCYDFPAAVEHQHHHQQQQQQPIYLPSARTRDALDVDECLKYIPQIMERCDELLAVEPVRFTKSSPESILYVAQGEVAHAVPSQGCDVIMSDKATTCHILALRSTSDDAQQEPLVSLCHIDSTQYEDCIRSMFSRHAAHHHKTTATATPTTIRMDVHMVGGFDDVKGTSREISNWVVALLADLAAQYSNMMQVTLQTCAISSMNESGHESPIGRGLAIHLRSGQAFLASCDQDVAGPDACLRAVRLWCPPPCKNKKIKKALSCIHDEHCKAGSIITIAPFDFKPFAEIDRLLALPDHVLIQYCSTSPNCEEDDFCTLLRRTLHYLRTTTPQKVFGGPQQKARVYQRVANNTWKLLAT